MLEKASWIWLPPNESKPHQYVCFRKSFHLQSVMPNAFAEISADSDFILYVNGVEAGRGQFSDYPERKTFTRLKTGKSLRRGKNLISVLAYYRGEDFSEHRAGKPGITAALKSGKDFIPTDSSWKCIEHPAFKSGQMPRVTNQMGFTSFFDARKDIDWLNPAFDDGKWKNAAVQQRSGTSLHPRPVVPLSIEKRTPSSITAQGIFYRKEEKKSFAETMYNDALTALHPSLLFANPEFSGHGPYSGPAKSPSDFNPLVIKPVPEADGAYLIIDLGHEETGLIDFSLEAPDGTVIDIGHGEHLEDGRVRTYVGGRNFADRYICGEGKNDYTLPFRRAGARYLEFHFSKFKRDIKIKCLGLIPLHLPIENTGRFQSDDRLANSIYATGARTLRLCMHEHYEDCPWREQALYSYDSRLQALYGYYAFGNYDFAAASIELLGRGLREDGLLELCAPAKVKITIPVFSFVWISEIAEHWLHSGSPELFKTFSDEIKSILEKALSRHNPANGLYALPSGKEIWNFYEWTPGLCETPGDGYRKEKFHAAYNLYLHESLKSYGWMLSNSGDDREASKIEKLYISLGKAVNTNFLDAKRGHYFNKFKDRKNAHEHIQALALYEDIVQEKHKRKIFNSIYSRKLSESTLSSLFYLFKVFMESGMESREYASNLIAEYWGPMIAAGATSFWETKYGSRDFDYAGSLCHGWSALPVYYYHAYVLGIRPLLPGFRKFVISPYPGTFRNVSGPVMTPEGKIDVSWEKTAKGIVFSAEGPEKLIPSVMAFPEVPLASCRYNGKLLRKG